MNVDYELLQRLKRREQEALEEAIHHYAPYVGAVVRKTMESLGTTEDVEELISDSFVALWENADKLRPDSNLKYWLAVVARNRALKQLGRIRLEEPLEENQELLTEEGISGLTEQEDRCRLVRTAVDELGEEDRTIFLRHYFWYESVIKISKALGMKESTVKSRLKRGREKLRKRLMKEDYEL